MTIEIKKGTSSKTDKEYEYLSIKLNNGYEKKIFLVPAEMYMFKEELKNTPLRFKQVLYE